MLLHTDLLLLPFFMMEVELKILEIDPAIITQKILQLGGVLVTPERIVATQKFDTTQGEIKNKKDLFRIRKNGETIEITYKLNRSQNDGFRRAEEIETTVGDWEKIQRIIYALGFVSTQYQEKKRTTFSLNQTLIEIDVFPSIPPYIEIEGEEENIKKTVSDLGYSIDDTSSLSATEVLKHYKEDPDLQKY